MASTEIAEIQAPEAAKAGLGAALAKESAESLSSPTYAKAEAPASQNNNYLSSLQLEVPKNCAEIMAKTATPASLEQLTTASKESLVCLYNQSSAGKIPEGATDGKGIFLPGTKIGDAVSNFGDHVWKGKIFNPDGSLFNRILGQQLFEAEVKKGPSWMDGKESIIVDYKNKSFIAGFIRDEIREVKPGLYLGVAYARLPGGHIPASFFALDNNNKK